MNGFELAINIGLVVAMVLAAIATVLSVRLIRSAIGLAVTSLLLAAIMFRLNAPLAAVFELSVCAGLIPAIFVSAIGMTGRTAPDELAALRKEKLKRYWPLAVILLLAVAGLTQVVLPQLPAVPAAGAQDVRNVLWNSRQVDLVGQVVVLLAGALAVVVLVKERKSGS
jgi:NADH-quinone oxidoreductase subunit J